ncbi:cytosine deaminase [Parascardovia denticolens IPLA 20019]|nr:cytosine deaminase [Parascardovia denticolens IPLA 20019]
MKWAIPLFPFDGRRRLGGHIQDDSVDTSALIGDPGGNGSKHIVGDARPISGHGILGRNRSQDHGIAISTLVTLNAYGMDISQQNDRALPDITVQVGLGKLLTSDRIGFAQQIQTFLGDFANNADGKTRTGERLTPDDLIRQAQLGADCADLVLEQGTQRLDQAEIKVRRQTAHVMVALDVRGAGASAGLDHVRVKGPLHQELDLSPFVSGLGDDVTSGFLKGADELFANDLALALRLADAFQSAQEVFRGIHGHQLDSRRLDEIMLDLFHLPLAQEAMIHENAGQLLTDGLMDQGCSHGGIHSPGQAANHLFVTHLLANPGDLVFDDAGRIPLPGNASLIVQETLENVLPQRGVLDLRMPLDPVKFAGLVLHSSHRCAFRMGQDGEAFRCLAYGHPMTHPGALFLRGLNEDAFGVVDISLGLAILTQGGLIHVATQLVGHHLEAIANAQNRHAGIEDLLIDGRGPRLVDGSGAAGQDDGLGVFGQHVVDGHGMRHQLRIDVGLTHPTGDELGVLGAEIDH